MQDPSVSANWLQELLVLMGYQTSVNTSLVEASPEQGNVNSQNYWLEINTDNLNEQQIQRLIGQGGVVIDSLQYLASVFLNTPLSTEISESENYRSYTVELNGYRSQYLAGLQAIADQAVQQVRETKTEFAIKQLSSTDRRYIHQLLEGFTDITTQSQGREPNRHLIVKLVNS